MAEQVRTRTSRALADRAAAFTLPEILVVLTIIGLVMAMAIPTVSKAATRQHLHAAAQELVGTLQTARNAAVSEKRTVSVSFDAATPAYTSLAGTRVLPRTFTLSLDGGRVVSFHADGSADPLIIGLTAAQYQAIIEVDQATGLARIRP